MQAEVAHLIGVALAPTALLERERYGRLEATCDTAVYPRGGSPQTIQTRWEAIDEDISVASLLAGRGSGETPSSLRAWLESRTRAG